MAHGSIFVNNRSQAVRLPAEMRFPNNIKKVNVRAVGKDRIISPAENIWDSFFMSGQSVTDDFLTERASQIQTEREEF